METSLAFDFSTKLSAGVAGVTPETYRERMNTALGLLDKIEDTVKRMKIKSEADFKRAHDIKGLLCSLSCYTFNNKLPEDERVWAVEAVLGKKMSLWVKSQLAEPDDNLLIRYILWSKRYLADSEGRKKILDRLVEKGYIFIRPAGEYSQQEVVVTGIQCKVGDNMHTVDRNGREHRQFVNVCVPQCFELKDIDKEYLATKDLPILDKDLSMTDFRDGKGSARYPKFTRKDSARLFNLIQF